MSPFKLSNMSLAGSAEKMFSESRIVCFVFFAIGFAVFWPALHGAFVGDDVLRVIEYEPLLSGSLWDLLSYYKADRPIVMTTIWFNYQIGGTDPFVYKLTNLMSHILCALSGFVLLKKLLRILPFRNTISFFAAAIFLVHPLNHHVVQAAVQRSVSMAGIFLIWSFFYFISFYEKRSGRDYLLSLFMFLLAVLSKPVSIALPLALIIYLLLVKTKISEIVKWISVYFVFWLIPIFNYSGELPSGTSAVFKFEHWRYFLIQTKVFFIYLYKFVFPFPMEFIHSIHNSVEKIYEENFIPYLAAYTLILSSLTVWFLKRRTLTVALLLIAYVLYLPQSSFYSILHVLFYHRTYLSVLFGAAAISYVVISNKFLKERLHWAVAVLSVAILYFAMATFTYFSQVRTYSDWLWYNVQANPGNLNYNVSTLFVLKRRGYPEELIGQFAAFLAEHNPDAKEVQIATSVAMYSPEKADAKKKILDVAAYLSSVQTSNSFFHGAMLFLESEAYRFFPQEQAVLSLNSIYFSRLNTTVFLDDTVLKGFAKRNFQAVLQIQKPPGSVGEEKLEFFKLRSRIILFLYFKENTGLNFAETLNILQSKFGDLPESKWLIDKIHSSK